MAIDVSKYMRQFLIYYEKTGTTAYRPPVEVACRWDDMVEEVVTAGGRKIQSKSFLLTPFKLKEGSIVWLATTLVAGTAMAELRRQPWYPAIPTNLQGGYEVMIAGSNPGIDGQPLVFTARL